MCRNDELKPRTPVSAAVPTATAKTTKRNFVRDARSSRPPMRNAVRQGRDGGFGGSAALVGSLGTAHRQFILEHQTIAEEDAPVG